MVNWAILVGRIKIEQKALVNQLTAN